ncbi:unnamed protein product [Linum trigynum]|uniref:DUF4283 domain-containing protein n=1 Tax=Linum trigynum TaxID=586398 RepID=A0AAV2FCZ5_9ROSI
MSLTGRPPDLQPSSIHPDNPSAKAITSTPLPLNFKSALTGQSQGTSDTANQWLFVGEQDLISGTFGGEPSLQISDSFRDKLCIPWKKTSVIGLLGRSISYAYLCSQIRWKWRLTGHLDIMDLNNDTFLVTFNNEQDYLTALTEGPWVILDHYLVVHQWSPSFRTGQKPHRSVVAWIQLPELPVHFYHREVFVCLGESYWPHSEARLSHRAQERGKIARITMELDMSKPVPTRICLDGFWQAVQYENLPLICFECGCVGHTEESCLTKRSQSTMEIVVAQSGYGPWMQKGKAVKETNTSKTSHKTTTNQVWRPVGPNEASSSKHDQPTERPTTNNKTNKQGSESTGPVTQILGPNNTNIQVVVVPTLQLSGKENHDPTSIRQHYRKKTEGKPLTQEKKRGLSLKPSKKSVIVPSTARRELKWELSRNVKNPSFPITIQAIEALFTNNPNLATLATQPAIGNNDECMDKETVSRDISGIPGIIASQQAPILNETSPN